MRWILGGICFACACFGAEELSWQTAGNALRTRAQHSAAARSAKVGIFIYPGSFLPCSWQFHTKRQTELFHTLCGVQERISWRVMENGTSTFVLDATSKRKSKQSRIRPLIPTMSANATRSVAHRREGNNRVWFLSEEGKKLREIIEAK
jgi:predicted Fe-S protein YdhL (DUF1289 family)